MASHSGCYFAWNKMGVRLGKDATPTACKITMAIPAKAVKEEFENKGFKYAMISCKRYVEDSVATQPMPFGIVNVTPPNGEGLGLKVQSKLLKLPQIEETVTLKVTTVKRLFEDKVWDSFKAKTKKQRTKANASQDVMSWITVALGQPFAQKVNQVDRFNFYICGKDLGGESCGVLACTKTAASNLLE